MSETFRDVYIFVPVDVRSSIDAIFRILRFDLNLGIKHLVVLYHA
jgi:hypothetical protein